MAVYSDSTNLGINESNIIYVGKHGDDNNDGLTIDRAKLTFGSAMTSAASGDAIWCFDDGVYTENITGKENVDIFAPNATLSGAHTKEQWSVWNFNRLIVLTGTTGITYTGAGSGYVHAVSMDIAGNGIGFIATSTGNLHINITHIDVENGYFIGPTTAKFLYITFSGINASGTGTVFAGTTNVEMQIVGNQVKNIGAGNGQLFETASAGATEMHATIASVNLEKFTDITAGCICTLNAASINGSMAQAGAGTARMGGAWVIEGVPIGGITPSSGDFTTVTATTPVAVTSGGIGVGTLTDHGVLLGSGTAAVTALAEAATGATLMGSTGADPAFTGDPSFSGSVTAGTGLTVSSLGAGVVHSSAGGIFSSITPVTVANGGTGAATLTDHGILVGSGVGAVTVAAVGGTGELLVGAAGADPAFGTSATGDFTFTSTTASETRVLTVSNTDNTGAATSAANVQVTVGGANVGDPQTTYTVTGGSSWSTGIDNNATDAYKLSQGTALGTNDTFVMTTAGERTMPLQPIFFATQGAAENNITGDGTVAQIGAAAAMTEVYDIGGNFSPGNGAGTPATFTASVTGKYIFNIYLQYFIAATGGNTTWMSLLTSNRTYYNFNLPTTNKAAGFSGSNDRLATRVTIIADMDASDTAILQFASYGGAKVDDIVSSEFSGALYS